MLRLSAVALALASTLAGCGLFREPAPSGEPVSLGTLGEGACVQWIEGSLRPTRDGVDIEFTSLDTVDWPDGVDKQSSVSMMWPEGFTGVRVAGGDLAVVDGSGNLVAMTGRNYQLRGGFVTHEAPGYPGTKGIGGFLACGEEGSVIPG